MKTNPFAIVLVAICAILMSIAQIIFKFASFTFVLGVLSILTNFYFILGSVIYAAASVFLILALRRGDLSVIYPMVGISYILVSMLSPVFFPLDYMNIMKWSGVFLVVIGASVLGYGGRNG